MEKYFVGLYEKEVAHTEEGAITRHINYITAGDGMTAIVLQEEQGDDEEVEVNTYFTYKDHLGSIVALTDEDANVIIEQSFDSWGRYRNPSDWSYNNVSTTPTWLRGYTGHCLSRSIFSMFSYEIENSSKITIGEHLPHFDLVNMNGRIYDPILGRMLSPDRFVPDPLSTQGYNRYAYVLNNPLRYSDPSGDLPVLVGVAIGAVVGGYIGGAVANQTFAVWNWDFNDPNTWIGIGAGMVVGGLTGGAAAKAGLPAAQGKFLGMSKTQAKNFSSSMLSGIQNTYYQYDPDQGFGWHSVGHFAVGMGGSYAGIGTKSTLDAFGVGGLGNVVVNSIYYNAIDEDYTAYDMMQWFIGGGLTSYNGAKRAGMGNWKNKNYIIDKRTDYAFDKGFQALASDFAYDDYQNFFDKPLGHHFMTFGRGFFGGTFEMMAGYNHVMERGRELGPGATGQVGRQLFGMLLYSGAYSLEYAMYGLQEAGGNNVGFYSGGTHQKVGVYSHKMLFYSLGLY